MDRAITGDDVELVEGWADLRLKPARRKVVAELLSDRIRGANELSRMMAQPKLRSVTPAVGFLQPET